MMTRGYYPCGLQERLRDHASTSGEFGVSWEGREIARLKGAPADAPGLVTGRAAPD
jgi:hypothetical protein